ncbi:MAG: hypothetical protein H0X64_11365 [Gemmatimonadaceae bacterium]|nr:hypothetical protein [Trueperaceae bacterium]MBA3891117.1 hypothetical protein [Gemmatimonadaceae bacterium]
MTLERITLILLAMLLAGWTVGWLARLRATRRGRTVAVGWAPRTAEAKEQALLQVVPPQSDADDVLALAARTLLLTRLPNPLAILAGLRLEDALDVRRYGAAAADFERRAHHLEIDISGNAATVVMNVRDLAHSGRYLTFELTSSIQGGIARGTLQLARDGNGKLLAMVKDSRTGKVTDLLRGVPSGARLGALTATVYGLAHLVSAKDLATKLDALSGKVDLLLAFRSIDQRARLEAAYASVKELGMQQLDAAGLAELRRVRNELRELRHVWRGESMHRLRSLHALPHVTRVNRLFPRTKAKHAAHNAAVRDVVGLVALMEFSLRLEHLLAVAGDDAEPFLRVLPDELDGWEELTNLLHTTAEMIEYEDLAALPYVEAVKDVVNVYRDRTGTGIFTESAGEAVASIRDGSLPAGSSKV